MIGKCYFQQCAIATLECQSEAQLARVEELAFHGCSRKPTSIPASVSNIAPDAFDPDVIVVPIGRDPSRDHRPPILAERMAKSLCSQGGDVI
jgi:hypothetical protein